MSYMFLYTPTRFGSSHSISAAKLKGNTAFQQRELDNSLSAAMLEDTTAFQQLKVNNSISAAMLEGNAEFR